MSRRRIDHALVSLTNPASFAAEQYHGLGLKLERLRLARDVRVIGVTSPGIGDGKTVTSINLAAALARGTDARVLLVDADLRRPAIAGHLALDGHRRDLPPEGGSHDEPVPGLADLVLDATVSIQDTARPIVFSDFTFSFMSAGTLPASVHRLLRSPRFEEALRDLRSHYDYVVLDTPRWSPCPTRACCLVRSTACCSSSRPTGRRGNSARRP